MKSKSLLAVEVISTAFSYKILNEVTENAWLEVVEVSSGANAKNILIFQADDAQKLKTLKTRIEEKYGQPSRRVLEIFSPQIFDLCYIEEVHSDIFAALTSLVQNPVEQSLVVFETESICGTISGIDTVLKNHHLKLCDLKLVRQSGGMNHAFLTGSIADCVAAGAALKQLLFANYLIGEVEMIANPTAKIQQLFGFAKRSNE